MTYLNRKCLIVLLCFVFVTACSQKEESIYSGLSPEQDGVLSVIIPGDGTEADEPRTGVPEPSHVDELTSREQALVDQWHEGDIDKLSFIVVDARNKKVLKSYAAGIPQRLASVSKLSTALGALENVNNVSVSKVSTMLKTSHNGEASRYIRLAAKALDGFETPTNHYSQKASCPDEFFNDEPAALINFDWLASELPDVDWTGAGLFDGAGCHYDNFMSPLQTVKILEYAESRGAVYAGKDFEDLLSINGKDGTWKNKNLENKGAIFAKTGTLNPNGNLAGYFYSRRNGQLRKYYFAIFVQKKGPGSYSTKARKLIEGLMRYWIDYYAKNEGEVIKDF